MEKKKETTQFEIFSSSYQNSAQPYNQMGNTDTSRGKTVESVIRRAQAGLESLHPCSKTKNQRDCATRLVRRVRASYEFRLRVQFDSNPDSNPDTVIFFFSFFFFCLELFQ